MEQLPSYECRPQLVFSEWNENGKQIDSDIQNIYEGFDFSKFYHENEGDNDFDYFHKVDQCGFDKHFSNDNIVSKKYNCLNDTECVAFNSLGFFKSELVMLTESPYFSENDGIYVKKSYIDKLGYDLLNPPKHIVNSHINQFDNTKTIRVKMLCNWCTSKQLCDEWRNMCIEEYKWNNIEIVWDDTEVDYYVIINYPLNNNYYDEKKTLVFPMEPWIEDETKKWGMKTWGSWAKPEKEKFFHVHSRDSHLNNVQWQISVPKKFPLHRQDDVISILSSKNFDIGHKKRIDFIRFFQEKNSLHSIVAYGKENYHKFKFYGGALNDDKKENEFVNYKYVFSCENNTEFNYATEKLWEPILCECLTFYWGCPNIKDYIDENAYVQLDLDDFEGSYNIIMKAITEDWWSQRIEAIRKEKEKILNKIGFFPKLQSILLQESHS